MVYNAVYFDGKSKFSYVKRFQVLSSTRDRLYNLSAGNKDSNILYFENRQNGESEVINVFIHSSQKARKKIFEFDFGNLDIKGKSAKGNILSKYKQYYYYYTAISSKQKYYTRHKSRYWS